MNRDADANDFDAGLTLTALSQPTTVYKCKRPQAVGRDATSKRQRKDDAPARAFNKLTQYEATNTPRADRLRRYYECRQILSASFDQAMDELCSPLVASIEQWLTSIHSTSAQSSVESGSSSRSFVLPVAAVTALHSHPDLFLATSRKLRSSTQAHWAQSTLLETSSRSPGTIIESACRQWLVSMSHNTTAESTSGSASLWRALCQEHSSLSVNASSSFLYILVLPSLPSSSLFSTLSYLISSQANSPRIAIIVECGVTPAGLDELEWEEKRCLDVERFAAPSWTPRQFILQTFSSPPWADVLPPTALKYACEQAHGGSVGTSGMQDVRNWLELALQLRFSQEAKMGHIFSAESQASDFTPFYYDLVRLELIKAMSKSQQGLTTEAKPDFELLLEPLLARGSPQEILRDDEKLFASARTWAEEASRCRARTSLGLEFIRSLLKRTMSSSIALSTEEQQDNDIQDLRYLLLVTPTSIDAATSREDATKAARVLRQRIKEMIGPSLNALRRGESDAGALLLTSVDEWLDEVEDLLEGYNGAENRTVESDEHSQSPQAAVGVQQSVLRELLSEVRALQQELRIASDGSAKAQSSSTQGQDGAVPESARFDAVQQQLLREEMLRTFRSKLADWFANAVRHLLIAAPIVDPFQGPSAGEALAARVEALLNPTPRTSTTLAMARPHIYLEQFALSSRALLTQQSSTESKLKGASGPDNADGVAAAEDGHNVALTASGGSYQAETMEKLTANLVKLLQLDRQQQRSSSHGEDETLSLQTDLSLAYNLLREAGGAGSGDKGRMVNVYDWYQAWTASLQRHQKSSTDSEADEDGGGHSSGLQARFALALSTLALMGYIKKTKKGEGEAVLKVGGWDSIPGDE